MSANLPEVAVGAVCVRDGQLLIVQRGRPPSAGRWSIPGGRVRPRESLAEAVLRELAEETGLTGRVGPVCGVVEHIDPSWHFVIVDLWVEVDAGAAQAGDDAAEVAWVSRAELDRLDLVDGLIPFLDEHGVLDRLAP